MQSLSATTLLSAWERGAAQSSVRRALLLLAMLHPDMPMETLAGLPLSERDAQLAALRERLFGTQVRSVAPCPKCAERLELMFDARDLFTQHATSDLQLDVPTNNGGVTCRMPTSADLLALEAVRDVNAARAALAQRCVVRGTLEGDEAFAAVEQRLRQAYAEGDAQLALHCPACGHEWPMAFDIGAFLWGEVNDWALRLLRDVHTLAHAYGWREADILAMSARRRGLYLQMLGA